MVRAARLVQQLDAAISDPDGALDLQTCLAKLSFDAKRYVTLLIEDGAVSDAVAQKRLLLDREALALAIDEVEKVLAH